MDYLLSRENDAHESVRTRVARSVVIVYGKLSTQYISSFLDTTLSLN